MMELDNILGEMILHREVLSKYFNELDGQTFRNNHTIQETEV